MDVSGSYSHKRLKLFIRAAMTALFLDVLFVCVSPQGGGQLVTCGRGYVNNTNSTQDDGLIANLEALSTRDNLTNWVGLRVSWPPLPSTESTVYDVMLEERLSLTSPEYRSVSELSVTDDNSTLIEFPNLLAFWDYRVSVRARPENISSCTRSGTILAKTLTNAPGSVQNLQVRQGALIAKDIEISFGCPQEKSRNGTIIQYLIHKKLESPVDSLDRYYEARTDKCSKDFPCNCSLSAEDVGGVMVDNSYTFAVTAVNQDYTGNLTAKTSIYIAPRAPRFLQADLDIIVQLAIPATRFLPASTTLDLFICSRCLNDASQGAVTAVGLIVCVVADNSSCGDGGRLTEQNQTTCNFSSYPTWSRAEFFNFNTDYRATPDDWHETLLNSSDSLTLTLGADAGCDVRQVTEYCNGPLPSDKDITISVVKCNSAGCDCVPLEGVFTTKAQNVPPLNIVGLGFGIAMGCAVILTAFIMSLVSWVTAKRSTIKQDRSDIFGDHEGRKDSVKQDSYECGGESSSCGRKCNLQGGSSTIISSDFEASTDDVAEAGTDNVAGAATDNDAEAATDNVAVAATDNDVGRSPIVSLARSRENSRKLSGPNDDIQVISYEVIGLSSLQPVRPSDRHGSRRISLSSLM